MKTPGWILASAILGIGFSVSPLQAAGLGPSFGDAVHHDVSQPLRQLTSLPIPSQPMDAVQLKGVLEKTNLWAGFDGPCAAAAGSELTVLFEKKSQRFVIGKVVEDQRCMAVSLTDDASGAYDRYAFAVAAVFACDATCQSGFVTEHNRVRTRVNDHLMPAPVGFQPVAAPPLAPVSWDTTIAAGAQSWADGCSHTHSGAPGLGENLYYSAGSVPTPATAVASWESESTAYTYAAIGDPVNDFPAIGHYTQLVWANTGLIGCGVTHCTTNTPFPGFPEWDFIVCRYSPPGNFTGQFPYVAGVLCSTNAGCTDNNPCTDDICNSPGTPASSCSHVNNIGACEDGNACTGPDVCAAPPGCGTSQSFDAVSAPALPAGWTSTVAGSGTLWTTVSSSSDTAPNSAFVLDGSSVADQLLVSPTIAMGSPAATLTFRNRWSFESDNAPNGYDGGVLEIKIGGGAFTDIVAAGGSFVSNGYTGTVSASFANPIGGRSAWCAVSPGYPAYVTTTVNLPAAVAGQTIQLRWRVGTDTSVGAPGQNIDSIAVNCPAACTSGPASGAPQEVQGVAAAADKTTFTWPAVASATRYDVVRGSTSAFPVGPGGGDEVCFGDVLSPTVVDATVPSAGTGFWFLSRAENSCGSGTYGTQGVHGAPGAVRVTTTCP